MSVFSNLRLLTDRFVLPAPKLKLSGSRGIITTYNGNEQYFQDTFLKYYRNVWKPDWIVSLSGTSSTPEPGIPFGLYRGQVSQSDSDHYVVQYQSPERQEQPQWNQMRDRLFARVRQSASSARILAIDCDEFIYGDIEELWKADSFLSHFVEYVPRKPFDPTQTGTWSTQAWYYRAQAREESNQNVHFRCKRFPIKEGTIGFHASEDCGYDSPDTANGRSVTYHVGVANKAHFLSSKHFDQTTATGASIGKSNLRSLSDVFEKYYANCKCETFEFRLWDLLNDDR